MAKLISLVKHPDGISDTQFAERWRNDVLPAMLHLPVIAGRLSRAVHHHVLPTHLREGEGLPASAWAGIGCYHFDSQADAEALLADADYAALVATQPATISEITHLIVDEIWMYDHDPSPMPLKVFAFFKVKPAIGREEGLRYYRTTHAEVGAAVNKGRIRRYVQNHAVAGFHSAEPAYDYDGGPEIWFSSRAVMEDLYGDCEGMEILSADEEKFVLRDELIHVLTDEVVLFDRSSNT